MIIGSEITYKLQLNVVVEIYNWFQNLLNTERS